MRKQDEKKTSRVSGKPVKTVKDFTGKKVKKREGEDASFQSLDLKKKDEKNQQIEGLTEKLKQAESDNLYLRAEFENFKKRALEEKLALLRYEGERFMSSLATEVLDDLDRALSASKENKSLEDLKKGLEMIHRKANKLLNRFGVEIVDPTGKVFDPSYQEALN
ncbi:MAG: nucleotide exchange factor GrpE, partial [Oligoflexia bacterium]|nr:nucleotide exchange factor GrpE [Oligoflexia bacterium]